MHPLGGRIQRKDSRSRTSIGQAHEGKVSVRVVITGATGNVGTIVIEALAEESKVTSILGIARRRPSWRPPKTTWAEADVVSDDLLPHFDGADAVVHLAWLFQPTHDPMTTWRNNVEGSVRVFRAGADARVPVLVYASSIGAYSPGPKDPPVDESWPTHGVPNAGYSREKAYVERLLDIFERDNPEVRVVRLRPAFIFKRTAASEQRRLFAGPFLPNALVRRALIPVVPDRPGLKFQALHSADAAQAYRLALLRPVKGAFNIAADPVLDGHKLAELLGARPLKLPPIPVRAVVAAAWRLRLIPASPQLVDLALSMPLLDATRARDELGWSPRYSSLDAIADFLEGLQEGAGMDTPPLQPWAGGSLRRKEIATGVGSKAEP